MLDFVGTFEKRFQKIWFCDFFLIFMHLEMNWYLSLFGITLFWEYIINLNYIGKNDK